MCCIIGGIGSSLTREKVLQALAATVSRGPDMTRVEEIPGGFLGFQRLSIMGLDERGMQPFHLGSHAVICNGELYGFRPIRDRLAASYDFKSHSDCEILLPLYDLYGTDMFRCLDAEFALLLWDGERKSLIAARDPIGIRPLFWGDLPDGGVIFASEAKNLMGLCDHIRPFPPGHYWAEGKLVRYADPARADQFRMVSEAEGARQLHDLLVEGVRKRLDADAPLGFLLSGGLDSSLVCAIAARELKKPIRTFSIGMEKDAIDLKYARQVADFIGSEHYEVIISPRDVTEALEEVIRAEATWDITTIRAGIGMYLVCKWIHEHTDVRVILTGEISDELFGYKYTDFAPNAQEFQKESEKRIRELYMYDVLRADRCISVHSLEARVPFGDLAFVRCAMELDPRLKMNNHQMGKYLIRSAFAADKLLPENILWRQKAAFSDAVGHSMVEDLKRLAEETYTDEAFEEKRRKYEYRMPFTKESLLYRELFEKHYPGQADMIVDYWMPNPEWPGCKVDDPSARVLANYGDSGL